MGRSVSLPQSLSSCHCLGNSPGARLPSPTQGAQGSSRTDGSVLSVLTGSKHAVVCKALVVLLEQGVAPHTLGTSGEIPQAALAVFQGTLRGPCDSVEAQTEMSLLLPA